MFKLRYLKNVATLKLDVPKCNGCRMCTIVCPHQVFSMENKRAKIVDLDACMECGACALNCPTAAISVKAGVGCATAVIYGALKGTEATCGCSCSDNNSTKKSSSCCG
jgi:NAD-dependent dihydropyrimidine dehydrogenase PreA subunit